MSYILLGCDLKTLSTGRKNMLLICTVFVFICLTLLTQERSFAKKHMFVHGIHVFACVTGVYYKPGESGIEYNIEFKLVESIGRKNELNIHRWNKNNVTLLIRAWLWYFYITFTFIAWSYCLINILLVRVRKYVQARKQGSKSVALCFGFCGAQMQ